MSNHAREKKCSGQFVEKKLSRVISIILRGRAKTVDLKNFALIE